jgi:hypothetical protein
MPIASGLKGGPGGAYGGQLPFCKSVFDPARASPACAIANLWEDSMKRLGLGIIVAIGLTLPALADRSQLIGEYVWTYNDTRLVSTSGFSAPPGLAPNGAAPLGQAYPTSGADTGIEHFNADGTGFVKGAGYSVNLGSPPLPPGANAPGSFSFQFTYVFNSDDTFTMTTVPGTFILFDTTGHKFAIVNGMQWVGKVSKDAKSHTLTTITPFVQTITIIGPPTTILYQTCRSNVVGFAAQ